MNTFSHTELSTSVHSHLGHHLIAEFYGASNLFESGPCEPVLRQAAEAAGAVVLQVNTHDFGDRMGFTGVALLAESHISVHTWPEHDYVAIDIFMCGALEPETSLKVLRDFFKPSEVTTQLLKRGNPAKLANTEISAPEGTS